MKLVRTDENFNLNNTTTYTSKHDIHHIHRVGLPLQLIFFLLFVSQPRAGKHPPSIPVPLFSVYRGSCSLHIHHQQRLLLSAGGGETRARIEAFSGDEN